MLEILLRGMIEITIIIVGTVNMAAQLDVCRSLWDLDARALDGYAEVEDFGLAGTLEGERDVAAKPKTPWTPIRRNPKNPIKVLEPSTAYTPGVLNCVRGAPPPPVVPKKSR
jgi:hypothetical protein